MLLRTPARSLADFQLLEQKLKKNQHDYDPVSWVQLQRIMRRRIRELTSELRRASAQSDTRHAA